jgi:hypothetical protein
MISLSMYGLVGEGMGMGKRGVLAPICKRGSIFTFTFTPLNDLRIICEDIFLKNCTLINKVSVKKKRV